MRSIRTLTVTGLLLTALAAPAPVVTSTRLDQKSVLTQTSFQFRITASKKGRDVQFSIAVHPNELAPSDSLDARLILVDGETEIMCVPVEPQRKQRTAYYEFEVASNYVAQSQFAFRDLGQTTAEKKGMAGSFWFVLKDFVLDK